jgi:hypothetical protein
MKGIPCTLKELSFKEDKVIITVTTSMPSRFAEVAGYIGDVIVVNIEPSQGKLPLSELDGEQVGTGDELVQLPLTMDGQMPEKPEGLDMKEVVKDILKEVGEEMAKTEGVTTSTDCDGKTRINFDTAWINKNRKKQKGGSKA